MKREISVQVPGKINLHLEVAGKRKDGFHGICSLFQTVSLCDQLKLRSLTDAERIVLNGNFSCTPENNTIVKAVRIFLSYTGDKTGVSIEVEKRIPEGSGLGGGSADGAGTLVGMNALRGNPLSKDQLAKLGEKIGSDVPFFLSGSAAVVSGRGENVAPIKPKTGYPVLLAVPDFSISTAEAYRWIDEDKVSVQLLRSPEEIIKLYERGQPGEWDFCNTFEQVLFTRYPSLEKVKNDFYSAGALFSRVTGSGSTVFALFSSREERERAKKLLSKGLFSIWEVEMLARSSAIVLQ